MAKQIALTLLIQVARIIGTLFDYLIIHFDKNTDHIPTYKSKAFDWCERLGFRFCKYNSDSTVYTNRPSLLDDGDCESLHSESG